MYRKANGTFLIDFLNNLISANGLVTVLMLQHFVNDFEDFRRAICGETI